MEDKKLSRSTYKGGTPPMVMAMRDVATIPDFVEYDIDPVASKKTRAARKKVAKARVQSKRIEKLGTMWVQLRALQSNFSFSKAKWIDALAALGCEKESSWPRKLSFDETQEWIMVIRKRLQLQAYHLSQAQRKAGGPPAWFIRIFDDADSGGKPMKRPSSSCDDGEESDGEDEDDSEESDGEEEEEKGEDDCAETQMLRSDESSEDSPAETMPASFPPIHREDYFTGYDRELKQAWRTTPEAPLKKEFSSNLFIGPAKRSDDFVKARFEDGFEAPVHDLTVEELRIMRTAELDSNTGPLYSKHHLMTGARYFATYVRRDDRITIWRLKRGAEANKKEQKVMLVVNWFRDEAYIDNGDDEQRRSDMFDKASHLGYLTCMSHFSIPFLVVKRISKNCLQTVVETYWKQV